MKTPIILEGKYCNKNYKYSNYIITYIKKGLN